MKGCDLCDGAARMYCESDQASLCWKCDAKVHGANFLVARHARVLLCRSCQAPTQWRAAGARITHIVSSCLRCAAGGKPARAGEGNRMIEEDEYDDDGDDDDEGGDDNDEEEEEEEEEGDNQVVPWTLTPPPPTSSSSGEESSARVKTNSGDLKRVRENADLGSENDSPCASSHHIHLAQFPAKSAAVEDGSPSVRRVQRRLRSPSTSSDGTGSHFLSRRSPAAFDFTSSASSSPPI